MRQIMRTTSLIAVFVYLLGAGAADHVSGAAPDARTSGLPAAPVDYAIDAARSEVRFTVTKLGFEDVTGVFRESEGTIRYDNERPEASRIQWRIRVASVLTDEKNRDESLQASEYFDAARHPYLEFSSQTVRRLGDGRLEVSGPLTMRGVTRPVVVTVRHVPGDPLPRFETDFTVNRYDFGITGGRVLGRLIGRSVRIHLVAAVR
jgi:polyisoprenoid-binding protein YceI